MTIDDNTLILYYYQNELSQDENKRVARALERDAHLRRRYDALVSALPEVHQASVEVPQRLKQSLHATIDGSVVPLTQHQRRPKAVRVGAGLAAAATLIIGLFILQPETDTTDATPQAAEAQVHPGHVPLVSTLTVHFNNARNTLTLLDERPDEWQTSAINDLLLRNRSLVNAAVTADAPDYARVLRAFGLRINRLGTSPTRSADASALRQQLLFEANVMLTKLSQLPSKTV
ncbi:MAG: hypothetical protein AAFN07_16925 [Pseudomonadota bacterium]